MFSSSTANICPEGFSLSIFVKKEKHYVAEKSKHIHYFVTFNLEVNSVTSISESVVSKSYHHNPSFRSGDTTLPETVIAQLFNTSNSSFQIEGSTEDPGSSVPTCQRGLTALQLKGELESDQTLGNDGRPPLEARSGSSLSEDSRRPRSC